ncbi:hypothetical protein TR74_13535 [Carbonactinospora thermoautotrophica]|uniref:Protein-L-isoaspartate O-methyltransferase n=2 Tax=Carbonactinospora thermoautotrophica TaxID=1469144 RepID=A0A132NFH8_9ACTN|nr:ATP-grasp peptide maturase system methyltransferase [Carbonactinospora thermoautotrophica]KWX08756.1 hypothetical protein TR74_13535 [Carbonactinospora thermoautotrophica]
MTVEDEAPAVDPQRVQALLRALADELEASGDLRSPQWRAAVEQVPRHVFLPRFYTAAPNAQGFTEYTPVTPEISGLDEWLTLAYQNETWVTQLDHSDGSWDTPGAVTGIPTSSSTLPGVVVRMLEDLQVYDGARVLEIGTGTGYSTALLCARLGDDLVTSVEYDAVLSAAAASRLASLGYRPALVVGDGAHGHPPGVPYDRVIATCSFTHVPPAWVEQAAPGAVILTTVVGSLGAYGYVRLTVSEDGTATGRFLPDTVSFMRSRTEGGPTVGSMMRPAYEAKKAGVPGRASALGGDVLGTDSFAWAVQLFMPGVLQVGLTEDGANGRWLLHPDGSWSCLETYPDGRDPQVFQGGPRRLWDEVETVHAWWAKSDRPALERYGLTVTRSEQRVWLDTPDAPDSWRLHA